MGDETGFGEKCPGLPCLEKNDEESRREVCSFVYVAAFSGCFFYDTAWKSLNYGHREAAW